MKYVKKLFFIFVLLFLFTPSIKASEINIYLFYSELCSTCAEEEKFLEQFVKENDVNLIKYEVTRDEGNAKLLKIIREKLNNKELTTPYTVIGTTGITGFSDTVKTQIKTAVEKYNSKEYNYVDIIYNVKNNIETDYEIYPPLEEFVLPFLGNFDAKDVSLPLVSIIIGFIDGFNPCAMWVLLFLISMLLNMKNRKKMWVIGITFLTTSAIVYLAFMLAWLKITITLTQISWVRLIIGLIALIGGIINLISYFKERKKENGCQVVDSNKRKSILKKIKNIISNAENGNLLNKQGSFILALVGVVGLAISVNLIELACSSGLPLIFTQILAINNLSFIEYLLYIFIYILFFLIDDVVIFVIAMKSLKVTGISTKYNKLSHLIGGIIMLLIGILMIVKPEWLMFNF